MFQQYSTRGEGPGSVLLSEKLLCVYSSAPWVTLTIPSDPLSHADVLAIFVEVKARRHTLSKCSNVLVWQIFLYTKSLLLCQQNFPGISAWMACPACLELFIWTVGSMIIIGVIIGTKWLPASAGPFLDLLTQTVTHSQLCNHTHLPQKTHPEKQKGRWI